MPLEVLLAWSYNIFMHRTNYNSRLSLPIIWIPSMFELQVRMRGRRIEERVEARGPRGLGRQLACDNRFEWRRALARHRLYSAGKLLPHVHTPAASAGALRQRLEAATPRLFRAATAAPAPH